MAEEFVRIDDDIVQVNTTTTVSLKSLSEEKDRCESVIADIDSKLAELESQREAHPELSEVFDTQILILVEDKQQEIININHLTTILNRYTI